VLDLRYYRLTYQHQRYFAADQPLTLAFNGDLGYGNSYSGKPYPVFKNFYAGGIGSVRGYETASLGPTRCVRHAPRWHAAVNRCRSRC
jgi:outer membrane protein insertion porin family